MFKLKVTGDVQLNKAVDDLADDMQKEIFNAIDRSVEVVARDAEAGAPKDTGAGAAGIRTETGTTRYGKPYGSVVCGEGDEYYMGFHEYGTSKMPARPFMRPAADNNRDNIVRWMRDAIRKAKWQ